MPDIASYTHEGGHAVNFDALRYELREGTLCAALCDGLNGSGGGDGAAEFCADALMAELLGGTAPTDAINSVSAAFGERQAASVALRSARTTAVCMRASQGLCAWAGVGDSRLYHFSGSGLSHVSPDDSAAYPAYRAGEITYEELRMQPQRSRLTACIGEARALAPHGGEFSMAAGDGLLLCSDGFWQYIYETEMAIDLAKAASAEAWLRAMLLRLIHRSRLSGDNLSALCCIISEGEENGY